MNTRKFFALLLFVIFLGPIQTGQAQGGVGLVDQANLTPVALYESIQYFSPVGQSFIPALPGLEATRLSQLGRNLYVLGGLPLAEKKTLLELAATAVLADGEVRIDEYELLRGVAALLDCPMPVLET